MFPQKLALTASPQGVFHHSFSLFPFSTIDRQTNKYKVSKSLMSMGSLLLINNVIIINKYNIFSSSLFYMVVIYWCSKSMTQCKKVWDEQPYCAKTLNKTYNIYSGLLLIFIILYCFDTLVASQSAAKMFESNSLQSGCQDSLGGGVITSLSLIFKLFISV